MSWRFYFPLSPICRCKFEYATKCILFIILRAAAEGDWFLLGTLIFFLRRMHFQYIQTSFDVLII